MRISPEVEIALSLAASEARRRKHEYITVEHLFYALLFDDGSKSVLRHAGGNPDELRKKLDLYLTSEIEEVDESQPPVPSIGFQRVVQRAAHHVQSSGHEELTGKNLLVALFSERDCYSVALLEANGVARLDLINYISHGVSKVDDDDLVSTGDDIETGGEDEEGGAAQDPLDRFAVNLNEEAKEGRIDPLIGRANEVERCIHILARRRKNNPLLIGEAGVGKTAIAEGLAWKITRGEVPNALKEAIIYSLDMGTLLAGTKFRGDFENRVKGVIKSVSKNPHAILFIDEIHTIIGAGAVSGGTMDASNLLKPALTSGKVRVIGSTTFQEFRSHIQKDRALARRFQRVDVNEPSVDETILILKGLRSKFEEFHGVKYKNSAMEAAAKLSDRYLQDRRLPDKAIDLVDEAGAALKLKTPGATVTEEHIEEVVARMAQIPPKNVTVDDKEQLRKLEPTLKAQIFGQDNAIQQLIAAIKMSRAGLRNAEKPIGNFLFTGPTGVGKTEVAKQLAKIMGIAFFRFDMSEYMERHTVSRLIGAPPGYVGYDNGGLLTEAIAKTPHAVLLLDEIEKAHPDVFNVLLQIMDHGTLTDNNGKASDFRHVILIMTSNVGARDLQQRALGFGTRDRSGADDKEYKNMFSPEFRNRLDARIRFAALGQEVMERIVDKFMGELGGQLAERHVEINIDKDARAYLALKGYDPDQGARPMARLIDEEIKRPLTEELLFGKLEKGGVVSISKPAESLEFFFEAKPYEAPEEIRDDEPEDEPDEDEVDVEIEEE
jgi:ATP-dependent Clp protease ATP-binding subunit ClpA